MCANALFPLIDAFQCVADLQTLYDSTLMALDSPYLPPWPSGTLLHVLPSSPATLPTGSAPGHLLAFNPNMHVRFNDVLVFPAPGTYLIAFGVVYNILVVWIDLDAS